VFLPHERESKKEIKAAAGKRPLVEKPLSDTRKKGMGLRGLLFLLGSEKRGKKDEISNCIQKVFILAKDPMRNRRQGRRRGKERVSPTLLHTGLQSERGEREEKVPTK